MQLIDDHTENLTTSDPSSFVPISDEMGCSAVEGEYSQDDDSDDDYNSIQRPAFVVTGEPDFESGPPQDGLEYLRRVRYHFHLPVFVASVNVFLVVLLVGVIENHHTPCWMISFAYLYSEKKCTEAFLTITTIWLSNQLKPQGAE